MELNISAHTGWKSRYHFAWGTKYKFEIITKPVSKYLKEVVIGICQRYGYIFDAVGTDGDHVHLFLGVPPGESPEVIMKTVKSITARKIFSEFPSLKKLLWGGSLWDIGYYWGTMGETKAEQAMRDYVQNQGSKEEKARAKQLKLI